MRIKSVRPERYVAAGQIVLAICLVICTVLLPQYFFSWDQGGVSNYGTRAQTEALYAIGFGGAGLGAVLATAALPMSTTRRTVLRVLLLLLASLYALVLFSTFGYKMDNSLRLFHEHAAQALLFGGLILASYLRSVLRADVLIRKVFVVLCAGALLAVLTLLGWLHLLFTAQVVCGASFAYILTRGVALLTRPS